LYCYSDEVAARRPSIATHGLSTVIPRGLPTCWGTSVTAFGATFACFGLGSGSKRELRAPNVTKMPAVKAAQRVPSVRAPKMISLAAGQFTPKAVMNDLSIPPESPELRAA